MVRLVPFVLPNALCFAIPGTILFSACSVFGRMASDNEVVAIKSLGIRPYAVIAPALTFAFLISLTAVWMIDMAYSWGYLGTQRVIASSLEEIAYSVLSTKRHFSAKRFSISVADVEGRRLIRPTIYLRTANSDSMTLISAREAELKADFMEGLLHLELVDGYVELDGERTLRFPDTVRQTVPFADPGDSFTHSNHPSHMRLDEIPGATVEQREKMKSDQQLMAARAALQMVSGDFAELRDASWQRRATAMRGGMMRLHRLQTEPHRRWASGFSCLCFVFVGVPLAIRLRNSDYFSTFGICFLPILLVYYPLFAFGLDGAKNGRLPPYSVWLGNIVCIVVGALLYRRLVRH
jgi:lipopolysaccharide export system permease protein